MYLLSDSPRLSCASVEKFGRRAFRSLTNNLPRVYVTLQVNTSRCWTLNLEDRRGQRYAGSKSGGTRQRHAGLPVGHHCGQWPWMLLHEDPLQS